MGYRDPVKPWRDRLKCVRRWSIQCSLDMTVVSVDASDLPCDIIPLTE
ncbi:MAG: hypothetical protein ACTSXC_06985 [Candidatus Freyarchaeota archaeon]|nr:hypothetical protein [Candidatus Freyrarchaeum guaymaensis]